jgi:tetratricopeptide (TPR) repeat protein
LLLGGLSDQERCRAHELRAEAGLRLRNQAFALRELDRALAACPGRAGALLLRGRLRLAAGKPAEALADLDQGLALSQTKAPGKKLALPHALRGQARMALGQIEAAAQDANTALALNRREPEAHYLQSLIWEARQQPQAALLSMETAYKLKFRPGAPLSFMSAQGKAWGRRLVILRMMVQKNRQSAK